MRIVQGRRGQQSWRRLYRNIVTYLKDIRL